MYSSGANYIYQGNMTSLSVQLTLNETGGVKLMLWLKYNNLIGIPYTLLNVSNLIFFVLFVWAAQSNR
jgi:hypothetical protein